MLAFEIGRLPGESGETQARQCLFWKRFRARFSDSRYATLVGKMEIRAQLLICLRMGNKTPFRIWFGYASQRHIFVPASLLLTVAPIGDLLPVGQSCGREESDEPLGKLEHLVFPWSSVRKAEG